VGEGGKLVIGTPRLFFRKAKAIKIAVRFMDRLCGLVVRVLGYRSGGPGSIPDTTRKKK
jgi:hypothetical protein